MLMVNGAMALGDVPNDFEAAADLQYTPVRESWYYGTPVTGKMFNDPGAGTRRYLGHKFAKGNIQAFEMLELQRLVALQRRQTMLQTIATASVAVIASLALIKAFRGG